MRIILVNGTFDLYGGAEIMNYRIADMLKRHGHEVFFFCSDKKPYYDENYEYINYFPKYETQIPKNSIKSIKKYYNFEARDKLRKFIKLIKPDIIHIHGFEILTPSILDACIGVPTVMMLHSICVNICPRRILLKADGNCFQNIECRNGQFYNCIKNKCFGNRFQTYIRGVICACVQYLYFTHNIDYYIAASKAIKNIFLEADKRLSKNRIEAIYNFLPRDMIENVVPNYNNNGYFLFVGRLEEGKGLKDLLKAMSVLRDTKLRIVGEGASKNELMTYVKDNNLENVDFVGFKSGKELIEEYNNCIALIVPSTAYEAFGLINIEAFINGKPVIASNIGGIPEVVEHNKTGLLFESGNIEQPKECILKYKNNPELVIEHGKNAYKKAIENYTEDVCYEKLMHVYNEVLCEYKK